MKPKTREVLEMAIENGLAYGIRRLFKYREELTINEVELDLRKEDLVGHIMGEIGEWFDFEEVKSYEESY